MNESNPARARSPELMNRHDTVLLAVDLQQKLVPVMRGPELLVWNVRRLCDAAELLGMPMVATEQYPQGLGPTVEPLQRKFAAPREKRVFSCLGCEALLDEHRQAGRHRVLLAGIETHVCVLQTAFDLLADGWRVYLPVDATSSRHELDHTIALRRMESAGVTLTSVEASLFELCHTAAAPEFKALSALAKETPPGV